MITSDSPTRKPTQSSPNSEPRRPLVSIIIPFWNTEKFLQEAIDSVVSQSYSNWELLLVDDGSTDLSTEVAQRCAKQNPENIQWLQHENHENRGISASRNLGVRHATGDYVCFLDADDVFLSHKLERELSLFEANPTAAVVCGAFEYWYSWTGSERDAHRDFIVRLGVAAERLYEPPQLLLHNLRAGGRKPGTSSIMFKRETLTVEACHESFVGLGDDQVFWAKLSLLLPVFVTDECLFKYRQHPDSFCAVAMENVDDLVAWQRFLNWLEHYLNSEKIDRPEICKTLKSCQRSIAFQIRFPALKKLARRILSLRTRYWLRDGWIKLQSLRSP